VGAELHRRHGTTTLVASLVTASQPDLIEQIRALAPLVDDGTFAGIHLEGPWLSHHRCGAHDPALLRAPEPAEVAALIDAGGGRIIMATIAPELPGVIAAIEQMTAAGVVAAVGHTDCSADQARRAVDSGATVATHLLNQMPAIHKRAGGPVVALLDDPRVTVELIPDGVHVDPALIGFLVRSLGPDRVAAVTDAMGAAGAPDGDYRIGALDVVVSGGVANLAGGGPLAGSTLTMDPDRDRQRADIPHACGSDGLGRSRPDRSGYARGSGGSGTDHAATHPGDVGGSVAGPDCTGGFVGGSPLTGVGISDPLSAVLPVVADLFQLAALGLGCQSPYEDPCQHGHEREEAERHRAADLLHR